jgi:CBS domain-containing protein
MAQRLRPKGSMKINELMTKNPEFVTPDDSVTDVARIMAREDVGLVPVCESRETRRCIGCITDRDIVVRLVAQEKDTRAAGSIEEAMTHEIFSCSPNDDVEGCKRIMQEQRIRRVLVLDEYGALVGVVSTADLARSLDAGKVGEAVQEISRE